MQAARHETTPWEEMALEPIDQQTAPPNFGLLPCPDMGFGNGANWTHDPGSISDTAPVSNATAGQFDGNQPAPVFIGHFENAFPNLEATSPEAQIGSWNSAGPRFPNTGLSSFLVPGSFIANLPVEASVENEYFTSMNMDFIELDFFNGFPSVDYANAIAPNQTAPMVGPATYTPPLINPDSTSYVPAQAPAQQPVLPSGQQAPQRTTCTRCPRTFSRRTDLPRHMASVHGVGRRTHQCPRPGCGKTYSRSDKVLEHRRKAGH
ncbi:hypothetical protein BGAL_0205g00170 [Botrytis galanthina]|uniref:C2H2-type domain-containing protein n=1 Tax=Botrytis galanthina TaxID=278940 RepID=A0A4S8R503_9HELO|nr:hypothetical protein BGAL_0205g00170 [Botrytis galanthina]